MNGKAQQLIWTLLVLFQGTQTCVGQCTLCEEGITEPDKNLTLNGFPFIKTCGDLQAVLPFLDEEQCGLVRSLSSLCGCPVGMNACQMCAEGKRPDPTKELAVFARVLNGFVPTCDVYESYLHSIDKTEPSCELSRALVSDYCECGPDSTSTTTTTTTDNIFDQKPVCTVCANGESLPNREKKINLTGLPFETCGEYSDLATTLLVEDSDFCGLLQSVVAPLCDCPLHHEPCPLCPDGQPVLFPDKVINFFDPVLGMKPTCALVEAQVRSSVEAGTDECWDAQFFSSYCGCAPVEDHCVFCDGEPFPVKDRKLNFLKVHGLVVDGVQPTCELLETFQYRLHRKSTPCLHLDLRSFLCGCNNGISDYGIAADTNWKRALLSWAGRTGGTLSFVCALTAIIYIASSRRRRSQVYNQVVAAMFVFDAITGVAWMIGSTFTPKTFDGDPTGIYGANGNDHTCRLLGFVTQLGFTSGLYSVSLAIYYKLVIVDGWRSSRLRKIRVWLHGVPLTVGFTLAFAGLPEYTLQIFGCYFVNYPLKYRWQDLTFFALVPGVLSITTITGLTIRIFLHVYWESKRSNKWRGSNIMARASQRVLAHQSRAGVATHQAHDENSSRSFSAVVALAGSDSEMTMALYDSAGTFNHSTTGLQVDGADDVAGAVRPQRKKCIAADGASHEIENDGSSVEIALPRNEFNRVRRGSTSSAASLSAGDVDNPELEENAVDGANENGSASTLISAAATRTVEPSNANNRVSVKMTSRLEKEVFWHVIAYLLAFWITWPILLVALFLQGWKMYWFGVAAFFMGPLQGFNNFLVYFRSYFTKRLRKRRERLRQQRARDSGEEDGTKNQRRCLQCWRSSDLIASVSLNPSSLFESHASYAPDAASQEVRPSVFDDEDEDPNVLIATERNERQSTHLHHPHNSANVRFGSVDGLGAIEEEREQVARFS